MPERVFKETTLTSIEAIEADIVDAFAARVGDEELMVFEVFNDASVPVLQEAIISCKQMFFDVGCLPVVRIKPALNQSNQVLALIAFAFLESLNQFVPSLDREEMKQALFNNASLFVRNSEPELVMELVEKEFNDLIVDFLAKS